MEERLGMALAEYRNPDNVKSQRKIAREHSISPLTFQGRVGTKNTAACGSKKEHDQKRQRLSPEEENALVDWALQMEAWGWRGFRAWSRPGVGAWSRQGFGA